MKYKDNKWCYDCTHHRSYYFCGYAESSCEIYGSLDVDQRKRHPDRTANTCPDYNQKSGPRWYEKLGIDGNERIKHGL